MKIGLSIHPNRPMGEIVAAVRHAEASGFQRVWFADENPATGYRDVFTVISSVACSTDRISLGPGVTIPYTRNPVHIANILATLTESFGPRFVLGLGRGGSFPLNALGIEIQEPILAMREAIKIIKAMFSGERLSYQGRIFMARNVMLDPAPEKPIPIYVAARGQKMLALAGELADGVLLQTPSENVDPLVQTIRAGCDKSGRNLNDLDIFNYVILSVSASDPQAARESVRLHVAWIISDSPASVLEKIGVTAERVDRIRLALRKDVTEASSLVTDDMIDALSVAGSSNMCRERIQTLLAKTRSNLVFSIKPNYEEAISFLRGEVLDAPS